MMQRLEQRLFYCFLFAIPFQTRLIIGRWTPIDGYSLASARPPFNEWTSGFLYGTDLLILGLLMFWLIRLLKARRWPVYRPKIDILLLGFFIVSALSLFDSHILVISFYRLVKLAEYMALYFYIRDNLYSLFSWEIALEIITYSALLQSIIAIIQSWTQHSIGFRLLGESVLGLNMSGVAVFVVNSQRFLRAYGTTPHPNVLALFLFGVLCALMAYATWTEASREVFKKLSGAMYVVILWAFLLTFSRTMIGIWLVIFSFLAVRILYGIYTKQDFGLSRGFPKLVIASLVTLLLFCFSYWPQVISRALISTSEEAVTQRVFYNNVAASVTYSHFILGVGIGQFVPDLMGEFRRYPAGLYQPAHNIYLLISSETGILSLLFFIFFIGMRLRGARKILLGRDSLFCIAILAFLGFLLLGLVDHLWWTLQQGALLFWIVLAIVDIVQNKAIVTHE